MTGIEEGDARRHGPLDHEVHRWDDARVAEVTARLTRRDFGSALPPVEPPAGAISVWPTWDEATTSGASLATKAWTSALATKVERALSHGVAVSCPACELPYDLPPATPLHETRCGVCRTKGLIGEPRMEQTASKRRVRCPSCDHAFTGPRGYAHLRCPACSLAVAPIELG
ncbi:MAG: hypothetical protein R3B82_09350 [Sandaracinaceae bacterium]